eukprot:Skav211913  [mRNA]  locus=scaffold2993:19094:23535:+ [translate_table: standard]
MSYNVLLPNSQDGWWIYKYYRDAQGSHTEWPQRQALLKKQIEERCLAPQEVSDMSFEEDFAKDAGYETLLHEPRTAEEKKGRMRPATCWRPSTFTKISAQHKDRTLILGLQGPGGCGAPLFVVNGHLSAGPAADRRLRQVHEALETVEKAGWDEGLVGWVGWGGWLGG